MGLKEAFGCTSEALSLFRICLGSLLVLELVLRFRFLHPFYSDEGTLPTGLLLPKIDTIYKVLCLHCHLGEMWQLQILLSVQIMAAIAFLIGYRTRLMACLSWYLYLSLTLRNTWLNFILDRYIHYLLFYSMFLPPMDTVWSFSSYQQRQSKPSNSNKPSIILPSNSLVVSPATMAIKLLVFWIYLDAGGGKYMDPLKGWTYHAQPLPALDTYTRHTVVARYVYALLGPEGLRLMTPTVVYVELLAAPIAFVGSFLRQRQIVNAAIAAICSLHIGIAFCLNNTVLLSLVACSAWCVFLPMGWEKKTNETTTATMEKTSQLFSTIMVLGMIGGNLWFETVGESSCDQTILYSTIFHCRWNVFVGAEEYVTWEIAPGLLADGSIVDVWGRTDTVDWRLPGAGAPCTSTSRPGRWRSFPYLAELDGEEGEVLWSYLCQQWDRENKVDTENPGRKLIKYNFFMLQADVLPNMGFSSTRKRLIHAHNCTQVMEQSHEELPESSTINPQRMEASNDKKDKAEDTTQSLDAEDETDLDDNRASSSEL